MMGFNLDNYEPVEERLARFWQDHPDGRVLTELAPAPEGQFVVRSEVYRDADDERPWATGYAHEVVGSTNVNKTSALENCETSAIGRALANAGYAPKGQRASREEMAKANRGEVAPELTAEQLKDLQHLESKLGDAHDAALNKIFEWAKVSSLDELNRAQADSVIQTWTKFVAEREAQEAAA